MKNYRPEQDRSMMVFYVLLETPNVKRPTAEALNIKKGGLKLVVNQ